MKFLPLDTVRIILIVALVILSIDLYEKWGDANALVAFEDSTSFDIPNAFPPATSSGPATSSAPATTPDISISLPPGIDGGNRPGEDIPAVSIEAVENQVEAATPTTGADQPVQIIAVETDLVKMGISPVGGQLIYAEMKKHPLILDQPDNGYALLSSDPNLYQVVQSGFISNDKQAPNHHSRYRLGSTGIRYQDGQRLTIVPLVFSNDTAQVLKEIIIDNQSYLVQEKYTVTNTGDQAWGMRLYTQVSASARITNRTFTPSYFGGGYYRFDDNYRKLDYDTFAEEPLSLDASDGWLAMIEHYFITAMVPPSGQNWHYYTKTLSEDGRTRYLIGMYADTVSLQPGAQKQLSFDYFIGPKHHKELEQVHPELGLSIDYGVLSFLSKPMFWLLDFFHDWTNNWGWAIVLLTMVVRLILYKPAEISFRSMARMREAGPEIQSIREQYKGDREQTGVRMMEVYKKRKINPLSGCLPILMQIPVFIALYWMLLESIELRQAPWIFWIHDLSVADPYYVLPILMGGFMVIQQKLNPAPPDPIQQKIFAAMPIILGGISLFFPAGLVLYWTVNNSLSILQQWLINKRIHEEIIKHRD